MDGHVEILKSLVDSLTTQLTNILVKLESINPILNRLLDESEHSNEISDDALDKLKEFKNEYSNNHKLMEQLPDTLDSIEDISVHINELQANIDIIKKQLVPVNKFTRFLLKPIGVALFLLAMIGSIMGLAEAIKFLVNR
jgi:chromosome segregation ATPase